MKRRVRLTESDLHRIVKESVRRIIKEEDERHIFYDPKGNGDDEWDEAGLNIYDFSMVKDADVAEFHSSPEGYIIYYDGDKFGEVWYDEISKCYRGESDDYMFGGYGEDFEGADLNGIFADIMDKATAADDDDDDYDEDW